MSRIPERWWSALGQLHRVLDSVYLHASRSLLCHEHPGLSLGKNVRIEPSVAFWLGPSSTVQIGDQSRVRKFSEVKVDGTLVIGQRVHIGPWVTLGALDSLTIGDDCLIAERVSIRDHEHVTTDAVAAYNSQGYVTRAITIGKNVWIGAGAVVVKGASLGDNCVVGANSVVTRSFPAGSVVAGAPARLIRSAAIQSSQ